MENFLSVCDVPVALCFFNRPEQLTQVFTCIKMAKPTQLFLIQDGARDNRIEDVENINKCRAIVSDIDWDCDVKRNYSEENLGCGMRIYSGITWAFTYVDRLIILEDDCVPSRSFFPFCEVILEKYKMDQRMGMISGMNHLEVYDKIPYDYFFATQGSIAGWATWKRMWDYIDYQLGFLENDNTIRLLDNYFDKNKQLSNPIRRGQQLRRIIRDGGKLSSWSYSFGIEVLLQSTLIIVPKYNLMSNIGIAQESAHSPTSLKYLPKRKRKLYNLKLFDFTFPLKHPEHVIEDIEYNGLVIKFMRTNYFERIETIIRRIVFGDTKGLIHGVKRHLGKRKIG